MTEAMRGVDPVRRKIMSSIRSKDMKPEMVVRRFLHARNYRYRLHRKDLPGHPDIAFGSRRKAIFVNGCFWHRHGGCPRATTPKTREAFWGEKFARNIQRDKAAREHLAELGWKVLTIWECETGDSAALEKRLIDFLAGGIMRTVELDSASLFGAHSEDWW